MVFYVFALTTIHATKTFSLLRSTFFIVITDRIHFDSFLTNSTFISLVGFYMIVECLCANANFVTNATLHVLFTKNYPMEPSAPACLRYCPTVQSLWVIICYIVHSLTICPFRSLLCHMICPTNHDFVRDRRS